MTSDEMIDAKDKKQDQYNQTQQQLLNDKSNSKTKRK